MSTPLSIQVLQQQGKISARLAFYCYQAGIYTIADLLEKHFAYDILIPVPGCSKKDNHKLEQLCRKSLETEAALIEYNWSEKFDRLTDDDLTAILEMHLSQLSVRAQNALLLKRHDYPNPRNFIIYLFNQRGRFNELPNAGVKTGSEIDAVVSHLVINFLDKKVRHQASTAHVNMGRQLADRLRITQHTGLTLARFIVDNLPAMLRMAEAIISESKWMTPFYWQVIREYADAKYDHHPKNLTEITAIVGIPKERVRHINYQMIASFSKLLKKSFAVVPASVLFNPYSNLKSKRYLLIYPGNASIWKEAEETHLSCVFIGITFRMMFGDHFDLLITKNRNACIMDRSLMNIAELEVAISIVSEWIHHPRKVEEEVHISYLFPKLVDEGPVSDGYHLLDFLATCLEAELSLTRKDALTFLLPPNTKWSRSDMVLAALQQAHEPMSLDELISYLEKHFPEMDHPQARVHAALMHTSEVITFGKTGLYGLKAWEQMDPHIKGGSIRQMIIDYIREKGEPVPKEELFRYVQQYRNTTANNILSNLYLDKGRRFIILKDGKIGLK